jgi:hypothetical protein
MPPPSPSLQALDAEKRACALLVGTPNFKVAGKARFPATYVFYKFSQTTNVFV